MSHKRDTLFRARKRPGKWKQYYGLGSLDTELKAGDLQAFDATGHYVPFALWAQQRRAEWIRRANEILHPIA